MNIENILKINTKLAPAKRVVVQILYSGNHFTNGLNSALKPLNITIQQYNVLRILRGQKGQPVTLSVIQERMINNNSNTTRLINKLVQKKLVLREIDENNRRKLKITITHKGLDMLSHVDPLVDDFESRVTYNLTNKELRMLNSLLEKLL